MHAIQTGASLFVGLGNMGRPMAARYAPGRELFVFDMDPAARATASENTGATALAGLDSIPNHVSTVLLMLPNSRTVETVLRGQSGLFARLQPGSMIIDMSSSEPGSTAALAEEAAEAGIAYVDAPVSGGVTGAITGDLAITVGGTPEAFSAALPHLQSMGTNIVHVGKAGTGHAAKALNNLLSATTLAAAAESLCAAASAGIQPETMVEVINGSTGRSQATEVKDPRHILTGKFDSGFAMDLMLKDLRIARKIFTDNSLEAPVVLAAESAAQTAGEHLEAASPDHTELVKHYERVNGLLLRGPRAAHQPTKPVAQP
ncbi:NAD(P)-dependent oxidoreductase [Arthrobacter sp. UYEF3]|uniref:NAD(P)-dependent oxidoreductase n=1 Tax=Arthrobacter sp. UYEF3 TaxID=1756365 RepID=UPI00339662D4